MSLPSGNWFEERACALGGRESCVQQSVCPDGSPELIRYYLTTAGERLYETDSCSHREPAPMLTTGKIVSAFERLPLPQAPLMIQPPNGKTLVNFDTVFYTTRKPFTRRIHLLGHRIEFRIEPNGFTWKFDDGHQIWTTTPGHRFTTPAALVHDITHRYLTKDTFHPSLDVTYQADFSVDGGRWRPVNGTVTIEGDPQTLQTFTATPHLEG